MSDEINDVYLKVDRLFKLGLKAQIKGSELSFNRFLHVDDLVQEKKYYVLIINNKGLHFNDLSGLYVGLIKIIEQELDKIKNEIDNYEHHKMHDLTYDETFVNYELEGLGYRECKLHKIIEQIEKNKTRKINY
ncbi:MAG: hypothetical protein A2X19_09510 [Bacteroidetes bacterium GWE2_39_28]|nr:MAG: hypothetical protein A2X19_09510 [Bacteroidetes bacterium GWE2_39_28]OFY12372.1 MAG: hypothetical protein A2X16_07255 [Bacteroidetes bacterium GWF2_39_10]OFZ12023.1 MAG: hypothetical protein A2465_08725 [Bacteroidetes bacterium RIFOXYC2_FULL_39_11]HCT94993.1 hypothetical protein [Rikenellaceae bacterium]